uniref:Fucosyltransferase n=1 Tax=Macrostomum lignano TaxID=282301 RepID=A0A1I8FLV3_9PLAT
MELRDLAALVRDRNAAAEIQFASVGELAVGYQCRFVQPTPLVSAWLPESSAATATGMRCCRPGLAHALLFHAYDLPSRRRLRRMRQTLPRNQLWIYYSIESPMQMTTQRCGRHCFESDLFTFPSYLFCENTRTLQREATYFNWRTMTYRRDSTIYTPYARFEPVVSATGEKHSGRVQLLSVQNPSQEILTELAKHIGACTFTDVVATEYCQTYYFHLSFENVFCRDYITEKFYSNGLWGTRCQWHFAGYSKEELEAVAPPQHFRLSTLLETS